MSPTQEEVSESLARVWSRREFLSPLPLKYSKRGYNDGTLVCAVGSVEAKKTEPPEQS